MKTAAITSATIGIAIMLAPSANAAEVKVVASNGLKAVIEALAPITSAPASTSSRPSTAPPCR